MDAGALRWGDGRGRDGDDALGAMISVEGVGLERNVNRWLRS